MAVKCYLGIVHSETEKQDKQIVRLRIYNKKPECMTGKTGYEGMKNKIDNFRNREHRERRNSGFTLAELLIVVAIIAVLVAIAIPVLNDKLEKARRAVDMHTARSVESILSTAFTDGTIQIHEGSKQYNQGYGAWVMIARDENHLPNQYKGKVKNGTLFCGTNPGVIVNGVEATGDWKDYNNNVEAILTGAGLNIDNLKVTSKGGDDGWDWIVIEIGYSRSGLTYRIYSGFAGQEAGTDQNLKGTTNIEKQTGRT